jgi:hypothetical protein
MRVTAAVKIVPRDVAFRVDPPRGTPEKHRGTRYIDGGKSTMKGEVEARGKGYRPVRNGQ